MISKEQKAKISSEFRKYGESFPNWYSCDAIISKVLSDALGTNIRCTNYEEMLTILSEAVEQNDNDTINDDINEIIDMCEHSIEFGNEHVSDGLSHKYYNGIIKNIIVKLNGISKRYVE